MLARRVAPPRDFLQKFLPSRDLKSLEKTRDVHNGFTTRRAALGAADLERPAGGDRRPLAGIFRVRVVPGKSPSGCHTAVFWVVRELLGSLLSLVALGAILEALGAHLGGSRGGSGESWGALGGVRGRLGPFLAALEPIFAVLARPWASLGRSWVALGRSWAALGCSWAALGPLLGRSWPLLGRSWAALGRSWAPLEGLLAALGALLTTFDDPSWRKLGSKMPSEAMLRQKHEFSKSIVKRKEKHTFLIPRWLRNAPRWPQDGSKSPLGRSWSLLDRSWAFFGRSWGVGKRSGGPLRAILQRSCPSWRELGVSGGDLGASKRGKRAPAREGGRQGGRRCSRAAWPPLETFCESFFLQGT